MMIKTLNLHVTEKPKERKNNQAKNQIQNFSAIILEEKKNDDGSENDLRHEDQG
jgi:hypothetical protein